jgi:hypothetical protein
VLEIGGGKMNQDDRVMLLLPRIVMFAVMLGLILFATHYILPGIQEAGPDAIVLNPWIQVGLFLTLTFFGALVGFWITFGDLINRTSSK